MFRKDILSINCQQLSATRGRVSTQHNFFTTMDYSPWLENGNLTIFETSNISETGMATPIKIGVHAQYIDLYLHEFFEPIPND